MSVPATGFPIRAIPTASRDALEKTVLDVPKMDCPSEERLIRMAFEGAPIRRLDFDLSRRQVTVRHEASAERLLELLATLNFGARVAETGQAQAHDLPPSATDNSERSSLTMLLAINAAMFVVEWSLAGSRSRPASSPTRSTCLPTPPSTP